jgi:putative protease
LPPGAPVFPQGAEIFHAASQETQQRYRFPISLPAKNRARRALHVRLEVQRDKIVVVAHSPRRHPREQDLEVRVALPYAASPARSGEGLEELPRRVFSQLGETRFELADFEFRNPEQRFVPVSEFKRLRRKLCAEIEERRISLRAARLAAAVQSCFGGLEESPSRPADRNLPLRWSLKVDRVAALDAFRDSDWRGLDELVVEAVSDSAETLAAQLPRLAAGLAGGPTAIRLALPAITRAWEQEDLERKIAALGAAGWRRWEAANLSAWELLRGVPDLNLAAGWPLYVLNRFAGLALLDLGARGVTLSPEDERANLCALLKTLGPRATVIVYQQTPLFISESCPQAGLAGGCPATGECSREEWRMESGRGQRLLVSRRGCRCTIRLEAPFCLAGRIAELAQAGACCFRVDCSHGPRLPGELRGLWRRLRAGQVLVNSEGHEGNYERGLK